MTAISVEGAPGVLRRGPLPASSGGPAISVTGDVVAVHDVESFLDVTSSEPIAKLLVGLEGQDGYYDLSLPARRGLRIARVDEEVTTFHHVAKRA